MSIPIVESFSDKNSLSKRFQSRGATLFMKDKDIEIRSKNILGFEDYERDIPKYFTRNECNSVNVDSPADKGCLSKFFQSMNKSIHKVEG